MSNEYTMQRHKRNHVTQVTFAPGTKDEPSIKPEYKEKETRKPIIESFGNTVPGMVTGIILIVLSVIVLIFNETAAVYSSQKLHDRLDGIVRLTSTDAIFQENNHKIVHAIGDLRTVQPLHDGQFGVSVHAIKLRRETQMYQWVEHSNAAEDDTRVYTKEWRSELIDSDTFVNPNRHQNKKEMPIKDITYIATHAYIGNYYLKESIKEKIEDFKPLPPMESSKRSDIKQIDGWYYAGRDPVRPAIGDVRAKFSYAGLSGESDGILGPPQKISLIAKQISGHLTKFLVNKKQMDILHYGEKSPEVMVAAELKINRSMKWLVRIGATLILFAGLTLSSSYVYSIASHSPHLQDLYLSQPLVFKAVVTVLIVMIIISLSWLSLKFVFLLCLFILVFIPFLIIIKVDKPKKSKSNSSV